MRSRLGFNTPETPYVPRYETNARHPPRRYLWALQRARTPRQCRLRVFVVVLALGGGVAACRPCTWRPTAPPPPRTLPAHAARDEGSRAQGNLGALPAGGGQRRTTAVRSEWKLGGPIKGKPGVQICVARAAGSRRGSSRALARAGLESSMGLRSTKQLWAAHTVYIRSPYGGPAKAAKNRDHL